MRLVVRILGTEVFAIETGPEVNDGPGDCTTQPIGFVQSPGDQRWAERTDYQ